MFFEGRGEWSRLPCYSLLKLGSVGRYCAGYLEIGRGAWGHGRATNARNVQGELRKNTEDLPVLESPTFFRPKHHPGTSALAAGWLPFGPSAMNVPKKPRLLVTSSSPRTCFHEILPNSPYISVRTVLTSGANLPNVHLWVGIYRVFES